MTLYKSFEEAVQEIADSMGVPIDQETRDQIARNTDALIHGVMEISERICRDRKRKLVGTEDLVNATLEHTPVLGDVLVAMAEQDHPAPPEQLMREETADGPAAGFRSADR